MKKIYIFACFFVFSQFVTAQTNTPIYGRLSHGFNTREIINKNGERDYEYFIIDNDKYTNVLIKESWEFDEYIGSGVRYEIPYTDSYLIITLRGGGDVGVFDTLSMGAPIKNIHTENMLTQNFKDGSIIKYYNTPENEIEHLYLTLFVRNMIRIINLFYLSSLGFTYRDYISFLSYERSEFFDLLLPNFKKSELAIIRSLLFARHNYAFSSDFWQKFMDMYYPENYNGLYTELESRENFNWIEQWMLDLTIQYENKNPLVQGDFIAQNTRAYDFNIGGKYNIIQYRANIRKEPNINSDVIAILSVHDEIEILENSLIEEEINNFLAFWYKIKYGNIVGYTFGGNIACRKVIADIDSNGINDYFYLRCYRYMHPDRKTSRSSPYDRFLTNRDLVIYINNRRIKTSGIRGSDGYIIDRSTFLNFRNYVLIQLINYGWDSRDITFYKVNSDGSIERVGSVSHQGFWD